MTDDGIGIFLVFIKEVIGSGESNLIDVFVDFFGGHTYASVADGDCFLTYIHLYGQVTHFAFEVAF